MVMAEGVMSELSSVKVHVVVTVVTVAVSLTRVWHHTEATTGVSPAEAFPPVLSPAERGRHTAVQLTTLNCLGECQSGQCSHIHRGEIFLIFGCFT